MKRKICSTWRSRSLRRESMIGLMPSQFVLFSYIGSSHKRHVPMNSIPSSRLGCQILVRDDMEGMKVSNQTNQWSNWWQFSLGSRLFCSRRVSLGKNSR